MRVRRPPRLVLIGIAGVLLVAVVAYFAFAKRIPFVHGYRFKAEFRSSNQLVTGFSPVRIAGVTVGKVVGIDKGRDGTTSVEMEVEDSALPLHRDATARIRPRLFLEGGFAVELTSGSPDAPDLPDGGTLPTAQTSLPVQFDQILGTFDTSTRKSLQQLVGALDTGFSDGGARALGGAFKPLSPALRDSAVVAEAVRGPRTHDLSEGIGATSRITAALASRDAELRELVTSFARTTTALAQRDTELTATVRATDRLVRQAPGSLDRLDESLPSIERFVTALRPGLRRLPASLNRTLPVLDQLDRLTRPAELSGLVDDATPAIQRLPQLQTRLKTLFDLVTPVSACVRDNAIPTLNAEIQDGKLSTNRPVWQELSTALVGLSGASQDFDGNGFAIRFLGGLGLQTISTGSAPGVEGVLRALSTEPVTGANPRWLGPGNEPPVRPDVACADSAVPDLTQRTGNGVAASSRALRGEQREAARKREPVTRARLERAIDEARKAVQP